jgi:hypothetical protein
VAAADLPAGQTACFDFGAGGLDASRLPALELAFADGAAWLVDASALLVAQRWFAPLHCLAVYDDSYSRGRAIFGANILRGALVAFDTAARTISLRKEDGGCPMTDDPDRDAAKPHTHD